MVSEGGLELEGTLQKAHDIPKFSTAESKEAEISLQEGNTPQKPKPGPKKLKVGKGKSSKTLLPGRCVWEVLCSTAHTFN